jgi:hypothetical protein
MPPLSNLEVTGEPFLTCMDVTKEKEQTQVLIVPLRVNVNIKSKTMEELEATRKNILLSAMVDMHADSAQEVGELAQAMGTINALANKQETEFFNDQTAHLQITEEATSSAQANKDIVLRRRRWNLLEM